MSETLRQSIDRCNPNSLPDMLRTLGFGSFLLALIARLYMQDPAASAVQLATLEAISLPEGAKACKVLRATSRAGTVTGELTPVAYGVTPGSGEIAVAPNGDIVVLAADAITSLDVAWVPELYETYTLDLPVASDTAVLPSALTDLGVILLISATPTAGTLTGAKIVLVPSNSKPATTKANLNLAKNSVLFAVADAVSQATIVVAVVSRKDATAKLTAADGGMI
jgi:hypothetical protein